MKRVRYPTFLAVAAALVLTPASLMAKDKPAIATEATQPVLSGER